MENEEKWFHVEPANKSKQENPKTLMNIMSACAYLFVALIIAYVAILGVVAWDIAYIIFACCGLFAAFCVGRWFEDVVQRCRDDEE